MCNTIQCILFLAIVALLVSSPCSKAFAGTGEEESVIDPVSLAEEYAAKAFEAYKRKDYNNAVVLYRQAYDVVPTADVIYNIARIYDIGLRDRSLAISFYRRYIADSEASADLIRTANERLTVLRSAEAVSLEPIPAASPQHDSPVSQGVVSQDNPYQDTAISVEETTDSFDWTPTRISGLVFGIAGLAGLGLGVGFGVAAISDAETAHESCNGNSCTSQEGVDAAESGNTKGTVSTVGFAAGGALVVTGILLWALGPSRSSERSDATAKWQWSPVVTGSSLGLQIAGGW